MIKLVRAAALLPIVATSVVVLGSTTASASLAPGCTGTFTYQNTRVTVRCSSSVPGSEFRAVGDCASSTAVNYGPWVLQGGDHVSVVDCSFGFDDVTAGLR